MSFIYIIVIKYFLRLSLRLYRQLGNNNNRRIFKVEEFESQNLTRTVEFVVVIFAKAFLVVVYIRTVAATYVARKAWFVLGFIL